MADVVVIPCEGPQFPELVGRAPHIFYSPEIGERILHLYTEGESLAAIAKSEGMPSYTTILKWCRDSSKFAAEFERARAARAIYFEDQVAAIAQSPAVDKDYVAGERLKFDALIKVAEWGDPARFGKKVTVAGDQDRPIVFKVVTGVPENLNQLPPELNADGTQRHDKLIGGSSSEVEHCSTETRVEDGGSNPPSPTDPELEAHD